MKADCAVNRLTEAKEYVEESVSRNGRKVEKKGRIGCEHDPIFLTR